MKLTEAQIRQIINQELKNVINENQINPLHQEVESHIKELASLAKKAGKDQTLSMDLPNVTMEFIQKYKSQESADPMVYILAAASAWYSLYASDAARE
jgi:uncharacterized membrane-anchored protein YhcB (DUF1043 family)